MLTRTFVTELEMLAELMKALPSNQRQAVITFASGSRVPKQVKMPTEPLSTQLEMLATLVKTHPPRQREAVIAFARKLIAQGRVKQSRMLIKNGPAPSTSH